MKVNEFVKEIRKDVEWYKADGNVEGLISIIERQRNALDKLARLGNEPLYGNSLGNEIAKEALDMEV